MIDECRNLLDNADAVHKKVTELFILRSVCVCILIYCINFFVDYLTLCVLFSLDLYIIKFSEKFYAFYFVNLN